MLRLGTLSLFIAILIALVPVRPAAAHVLFIDKQTNIAAVFHSNPNDDPVAGEESELFFDIQDKNSSVRIPYSGYDLIITDETGQRTRLRMSASDSTVQAKYTFPSQGLYLLSVQSQPEYDAFQKVSINGSLRVTRGVGASAKPDNSLPLIGLVGSGTAIFLLGITFFNNREKILRNSKF